MRVDHVPQDDSILEGHRRACYARDADGRYVVATSRGWEVERIANRQANDDVAAHLAAVHADVRAGRLSVLAWHMACCHMDVAMLAAQAGLWRLRVHRHLRPDVFARLPQAMLARYADALGIDVATLCRLPE